jgi:hypothetical protein
MDDSGVSPSGSAFHQIVAHGSVATVVRRRQPSVMNGQDQAYKAQII